MKKLIGFIVSIVLIMSLSISIMAGNAPGGGGGPIFPNLPHDAPITIEAQ